MVWFSCLLQEYKYKDVEILFYTREIEKSLDKWKSRFLQSIDSNIMWKLSGNSLHLQDCRENEFQSIIRDRHLPTAGDIRFTTKKFLIPRNFIVSILTQHNQHVSFQQSKWNFTLIYVEISQKIFLLIAALSLWLAGNIYLAFILTSAWFHGNKKT